MMVRTRISSSKWAITELLPWNCGFEEFG